jgi:Ca-activated chloride channel family protein
MKQRDIERMLADQPAPPPPEGLAERIKQEIPDRIEVSPELDRSDRVVPFPLRRQILLAAAAVFVVALTATVTWQLRNAGPDRALFEAVVEDDAVTDEFRADEKLEPRSAPVSQDKVAEVGGERGRREGEEAPSTPREPVDTSTFAPAPGKDDAPGRQSELRKRELGASVSSKPAPTQVAIRDAKDAVAAPADEESPADVGADAAPEPKSRILAEESRARETQYREEQEASRQTVGAIKEQIRELDRIGEHADADALRGQVEVLQRAKVGKKGDLGGSAATAAASTGGTTEPNDQPYGDVFFRDYGVNPFIDTEDDRLSTFGLDVDTGSYTVVRRYLRDGHLPPREAVRVEEILNYFDYRDPRPGRGDFELAAEGGPSAFAKGERYQLLRFAISAREVTAEDRPSAVLTFVVDTSGSMARENRLGLVKKALYELLDNLRSDDRVGLVVYGSRGEVLLEPTTDHQAIRDAIDRLHASGSTNAEEGLVLAYELAGRYSDEKRINRVILCSDGVANVGRTGPESILERIGRATERGIELTTVGFGMGNYNDVLMERLADTGDGRYAYVDTLAEARRIFVEELTGTLMTVAQDAKAQVEFNPEVVSRYRLLGYENRDIADDRFRDPSVDAGEIGAGHTVTALYEIKLHERAAKFGRREVAATLRLRYRRPGDSQPVELERRFLVGDLARSWRESSASLKLAALAAEYAEILKGSYWAREGSLEDVLRRAQELSPEFAGNARVADFVSLVATAAELSGSRQQGLTYTEEITN